MDLTYFFIIRKKRKHTYHGGIITMKRIPALLFSVTLVIGITGCSTPALALRYVNGEQDAIGNYEYPGADAGEDAKTPAEKTWEFFKTIR